MKIFLFNSGWGTDYLADLIVGGLISEPSVTIYTNAICEYLYDDQTIESVFNLYGWGHTVCRKLDSSFRSKPIIVSEDQIEDLLSQKMFDLIVYSSVTRRSPSLNQKHPHFAADFIEIVKQYYPKEKIIAFDGEDTTTLLEPIVPYVTYYKRELIPEDANRALPVAFSFPKYWKMDPEYFESEKKSILAHNDPRDRSTYIYQNEKEYYRQYSRSLFAFTMKKAGWDCMRHYEILGSNAVPYFWGIEDKPTTIMCNWPIKLQLDANKLFERLHQSYLNNDAALLSDSDIEKYSKIQKEFDSWFRSESMSTIYYNILKESIN
jgi:hypothetical protein